MKFSLSYGKSPSHHLIVIYEFPVSVRVHSIKNPSIQTAIQKYVNTIDTGYKNISDIRTSFWEIDSFLYMCIENILVVRRTNIGISSE